MLATFLIAAVLTTGRTPAQEQATENYLSCLETQAARLEKSDEPAQSVAKAVAYWCQSEITTWAVLLEQDVDAVRGGVSLFHAEAMVVFARLCRKTGDCAKRE